MMANTMRILGAVCWRTWLKTARRPVVLAFSFVQPIMWLLFFGFLFHRTKVCCSDRSQTLGQSADSENEGAQKERCYRRLIERAKPFLLA